MGTTAQHCEQRLWTSRSSMLSASCDHQLRGVRESPAVNEGTSPPKLRSGGAFNRLRCLSLNLSTTLDSLPPSPSCVRSLKIPPAAHTRIWWVWQVSHQSRFPLLSQKESVPGQSFIFLKSVAFPGSAESWWAFCLIQERMLSHPAWHSSDSGQRSSL